MYKTNRQNHDFQIAYFIAGSCHTADGAYAILNDLKDDREMALAAYESGQLKKKIKILKAEKLLNSKDEIKRLEGEAELAEINSHKGLEEKNYRAAITELAFINTCIEKVQPFRKFAHLPDAESHEAAQQEEWKLELQQRAENYLLTTGSIPTDHFSTMRMHPEFQTSLLPHIETVKQLMGTVPITEALALLQNKEFDLPKLLEIA
jgi:hypothetical protein